MYVPKRVDRRDGTRCSDMMYTAASLTKYLKYTSEDEWIDRVFYIHTVE